MSDRPVNEVPEGASVFPFIPAELDVHPLLLAALHALVFLSGSSKDVVDTNAADEALAYIGGYLVRLRGADLNRVRLDIETLIGFARAEKWPKQELLFLRTFLSDHSIGEPEPPKQR